MKISGSSKFEKNVSAGSLSVSGSLGVGGSITVEEKISCAGSSKITGSVRCAELTVSGGITAGGDVEAEKVKISGKIHCGGLLNAEEITVKFSTGMEIGAIGGGKIAIYRDHSSKSVIRLPLLSSLIRDCGGSAVHVKTCIEGDQIALEGVTAQRVSGRVVAIGADCQIDLVQYSEQLEVSPDAKVGATEKI